MSLLVERKIGTRKKMKDIIKSIFQRNYMGVSMFELGK